ncbi:MAG: hypothetical protein ACKVH5_10145, partial [Fidelibacterota bacterium]
FEEVALKLLSFAVFWELTILKVCEIRLNSVTLLSLSDSAGHCVYYKEMLLIINFIKKLCERLGGVIALRRNESNH